MTKRRRVRHKVLLALLAGRFEPVEVVMCLSAIAHGAWLYFPYWETLTAGSISGGPRWMELVVAALLALAGVVHLFGLTFGIYQLRRYGAFAKFIMWSFFTILAIMASGWSSIVWFPLATLTFVSALLYLSISVGVSNGVE